MNLSTLQLFPSQRNPVGPARRAAWGLPKPRTGIAEGGKSGNWTSAASTLNHALARRGLYSTPIRHALTKGLKRVPYLGTASSAFELFDAIACK